MGRTLEERVAKLEANYENILLEIKRSNNMIIDNMEVRRDINERISRLETLQKQSEIENSTMSSNTIIMILATSILSPTMVFLIEELIRLVH